MPFVRPARFYRFNQTQAAAPPPPPPPPPSSPSIEIKAPANNGSAQAIPVTVSASAVANAPAASIGYVRFRANGSVFATVSAAAYSAAWSPSNGTYTLDAIATDDLGGSTTAASITFEVNVTPGAGTTLATLGVFNTSASSQEPGFITESFGHPFVMGDVSAADYPQFQLRSGTNVPYTNWSRGNWPDNSWRFSGFVLRVPASVASQKTVAASAGGMTFSDRTGIVSGTPIRLDYVTAAVSPNGLIFGRTYYARPGAGTTGVTIHDRYSAAYDEGTSAIAFTSAGTGTNRVNPGVEILVKNGGTNPGASSFTYSTITSNSDIKIRGTGEAAISGLNTSSVNSGMATSARVFEIGDGAVGRVFRVYQPFGNGDENVNVGAFHYLYALRNDAGGLYGIRYLGALRNGWIDTASAESVSMSALALLDGGSTVRNIISGTANKAVEWVSTNASGLRVSTTTDLTNQNGMIGCSFSSTGELPTPLSADTSYWLRTNGSTQIRIFASGAACASNASAITMTASGSGTHTMTILPVAEFYAMGPFTCGPTGKYDFIQAGGTGQETTTYVAVDKAYAISTKLLGPRLDDRQYTFVSASPYTIDLWVDESIYYSYEDTTGERYGLGYLPGTFWRAWHRQESTSWLAHRTHSYQRSHKVAALRRSTTLNPINQLNTTYAGMGTSIPSQYYRPTGPFSLGQTKPVYYTKRYGNYTYQHGDLPQMGAYLQWAEPHWMDSNVDQGVAGPSTITTRVLSIGSAAISAAFYNVVAGTDTVREQAWALAPAAWGLAIGPEVWNGYSAKDQWRETWDQNATWASAKLQTSGTSFAKSIGAPSDIGPGLRSWMNNYMEMVGQTAYIATQSTTIKSWIERYYTFYDNVRSNVGLYASHAYTSLYGSGTSSPQAIRMTSWGDWLTGSIVSGLTVSSDTNEFKYIAYDRKNGEFENGTKVATDPNSSQLDIGGMSARVVYFVRDHSAANNTFKLSTNSALSDELDITSNTSAGFSVSDGSRLFMRGSGVSVFATQGSGGNGPSTVAGKQWASIKMAVANGLTVSDGLVSAMQHLENQVSAQFANDAAYALKSTY